MIEKLLKVNSILNPETLTEEEKTSIKNCKTNIFLYSTLFGGVGTAITAVIANYWCKKNFLNI